MRGRLRPAAIAIAAVVGGGSVLAGCAGGGAAAGFHPAGSVQAGRDAAAAAPAAAPGGYHFPAGVSVQFTTPSSGSAARRAIITGYRNYVLSLWAAVLSHGKDTAYLKWASGGPVTFARREIAWFSHGRTVRGSIRYSGTTVSAVYFGHGANLTSCVDASAFQAVSARTGRALGSVFPHKFARFREDVAEARRPDGTWFVAQTQSFPAGTSEGAMCK